jgi:hypothetical protein
MRAMAVVIAVALCWSVPSPTEAQTDGWQWSVTPYLWATAIDGELSAGERSAPVFLSFADAADNLTGAVSFHAEASRGKWGVLTDLTFIRLSSSTDFTLAGRTIQGQVELDNVIFEIGGSYLLNQEARVGVIGGLRTYTLAPTLDFRGPNAGVTPIDASPTSPNAFVGVIFRPRLNDKWTLIGRADIGAGDADFTWSAVVGLEVNVVSWGAIQFGYKGLGIDAAGDDIVSDYQMTHYGPIAGFRFHWTK